MAEDVIDDRDAFIARLEANDGWCDCRHHFEDMHSIAGCAACDCDRMNIRLIQRVTKEPIDG